METAVVVEHVPTGIRAEANERRSQQQNRRVAIHRLRTALALKARSPSADAPSELWQQRAAGGNISINSQHEDFPALLAEALDVVTDRDGDVAIAAEFLGVSNSQFLKLLRLEKAALATLNRQRHSRGLPRLR